MAELYQGKGAFADALRSLAEAYDRSGDGKTAERLVRSQMATGHVEDARGIVERLEDEGGGLDRKLWIGWRWLDARQPERARSVAEAALKVSDAAGAHLLMGRALQELGQQDEAIAQLGKVPPRATQYVAAQALIGRMLRDRGRYREAVDTIGRAIVSVTGAEPGSATDALQDALAQVHEKAGEPAQAVRLLEQALARRPQSPDLAFALAGAYQRNGQIDRAVETVRASILRRDADNVQGLNFIGYALAQAGVRLDEARHVLEHAIALKPMDGSVADSLGWLYVKLGRLDDAESLLVRADRLTPEDPGDPRAPRRFVREALGPRARGGRLQARPAQQARRARAARDRRRADADRGGEARRRSRQLAVALRSRAAPRFAVHCAVRAAVA